jgi:Fe-coproporphyrin III synthase
MKKYPEEAIIAVTLNCNSRCVMCNIWKNKIINECPPSIYAKLPKTLKEINITGGEPFLRQDLPEIVNVMTKTCPNARLLINTNGYLTTVIKKLTPKILRINPKIAIRVSFDGLENTHDKIRGLPDFYNKAMESLNYFKSLGIKDLGISFTLMESNKFDMLKLYEFTSKHNLDFSLTVVSDSPIYFGQGKLSLRPVMNEEFKKDINRFLKNQYSSKKIKDWFRAWFDEKLFEYTESNIRYFTCDAVNNFFYMDSLANIYACHLKPWLLGSLAKSSFNKVFFSRDLVKIKGKVTNCNDCWMICTVRNNIKKKLLLVVKDIFLKKLSLLYGT